MKNEKNSGIVTLRIQSEALSIEEINQILQKSPSKFYQKGEKMSSRNPLSAVYEKNLWLLEFEEGHSFDELLLVVGKFFAKNRGSLLTLAVTCSIDLFCGYFPKQSQDSFSINHETLRNISYVPVDIIFDIYA